jgi:hypothetical protein
MRSLILLFAAAAALAAQQLAFSPQGGSKLEDRAQFPLVGSDEASSIPTDFRYGESGCGQPGLPCGVLKIGDGHSVFDIVQRAEIYVAAGQRRR